VSALFAPDCGSTCHDYTEQTIWDGDQVLGEIRTGGGFQQSGTIAYTHGGGLDAPLSLVRKGLTSGPVTIVPHSNWRGQYHAGSYTDGAVAGDSRLDLREVRWPAENAGAYLNPLRPFRRDAPWMGSLVQSSEDASGLMYRRNRYYDPKTGRFTQEDPIGLAGGLNTYGFADGDPVSYSDPYGLQPDPTCLINPGVCIALQHAHVVKDVLLEGAGVVVDVLGNALWGLATVGHCTCNGSLGPAPGFKRRTDLFQNESLGGAGNSGGSSAGRMQREVVRGQAPRSVKRVDRGRSHMEQDNVHFEGKHAINRDGTWKHGGRDLTRQEQDWLQSHGWSTP